MGLSPLRGQRSHLELAVHRMGSACSSPGSLKGSPFDVTSPTVSGGQQEKQRRRPVPSEEQAGKGSSRASGSPGIVERGIVLFAKAMVAMAYVSLAYGILVASFFFCCGVDGLGLANPAKSPLGPLVTIVVVWPIVGFLCLLLDGGLGDLLEGVEKSARWLIRAFRRSE